MTWVLCMCSLWLTRRAHRTWRPHAWVTAVEVLANIEKDTSTDDAS